MAQQLSKTGIASLGTIRPGHVSQSIDAFTGIEAYNISLSGSFNMTGSINGQPGIINPLTASYAISSSNALTSSYAATASYAFNAIIDTGSLVTTSSFNNYTGSSTSQFAGTSSFALTASWAINSLTASHVAGDIGDLGVSPLTVLVATVGVLSPSPLYDNGTSGVGAFLSGSTSGTIGSIDGVPLTVNDRVLVKNQGSQLQNGVYEITQTGSLSAPYILTRTIDSDDTSEFDPQIVIPSSGSTNKGLLFAQQTDLPTIGTSNIVYSQITPNVYVTQVTTGTQTQYQIPWWTSTSKQLSKGASNLQFNPTTNLLSLSGSLRVTGSTSISANLTSSRAIISGSTGTILGSILTVIGSGSSQPILKVQGSQGQLFSVTDNSSGSLFAVNNTSGLPILDVRSDNTILQGSFSSPSLNTTVKNTLASSGQFTVYSLPTSSYDGAWFEYVAKSGSNARVGQIMALWSGSSVNFLETTASQFGDTSGLSFIVARTGSDFALTGSVSTANWIIKTIIRGI
jgi:hypothetical protein